MKQRVWLVLGMAALLWAGVAHAADGDKQQFRFAPEKGEKADWKLSGLLLDIAMQGQSLGVQGDVLAAMKTGVEERDEQAKTTHVKLALSDVRASLNGEVSAPPAPEPVTLVVDEAGAVTAVEGAPQAGVTFTETGGVPVLLVAIIAQTIRFSDQPVGVEDEWQFEDKYQVPGLGEMPINTRWKLEALKDGVATISSVASATLPNFKVPNPMAPGTEMDVTGGRAYITELKQDYDVAKSALRKSEGKLRIDAQINMQGMNVPVSMVMSFALKPAEKPAEPPK